MVDLAKRLNMTGGKAHPFGMVNAIIHDEFDNGGCLISITINKNHNAEQVHKDLQHAVEQALGRSVTMDFTSYDEAIKAYQSEETS